ncbi:hypothetical protein BH10BAC6_BH10BAC6_13590 [soil metagenome]
MIIDKNSVVLITGASSGIGASLAVLCALRGATVALVARRADRLSAVADAVRAAGGAPVVIVADVSNEEDCDRIVRTTIEQAGTIDVLVNNAGRGNCASVENTTTEQLQNIMSLNVYALFWLTGRVLPIMKAQNSGSIITVSSVAGKMGFPFNAAYVAAKHAAVGFTAGLRAELMASNIHATVVCPDGVTTEWGMATEGSPIGELFVKGIRKSKRFAQDLGRPLPPLKRMISADDAAQVIFDTIEAGRSNDVYTHDGSREQTIAVATDRMMQEDAMSPLFLGMHEAYQELTTQQT